MISKRVKNLQPSKTLQATDTARQLKAQGKQVISLTVGEPDFNTPDYIIDYACNALKSGKGLHYTPVNGELEVREGIVHFYNEKFSTDYHCDQVFVGNGAKSVLYFIMQALLDDGDEVLIPNPYWVSYHEQVRLAGGVPVIMETQAEKNFVVTPEILEKYRTSKTKALLLNSPTNPTGAILNHEELKAIGEYCVANNIIVISDEIYNSLVYNGAPSLSIASISPEIRRNSIIVNGVSKAYAMTGWRIGYCFAEVEFIKAMNKIAGQASGNPAGVSQYATLGALSESQDAAEQMRQTFEKRLNKAYQAITELPGFHLPIKPQGAFYLFPECSEAAKRCGFETVEELSLAILNEVNVATVAGSAFGLPQHIRFSYAVSEDQFEEAMRRIAHFIKKHSKEEMIGSSDKGV